MFDFLKKLSLVQRIICGLIIGTLLGVAFPMATGLGIFGALFIGALKAVAPILVFVLVLASVANAKKGGGKTMKRVMTLYIVGTLSASFVAVVACEFNHITLPLADVAAAEGFKVATDITDVFKTLLMNLVANPVDSLVNANYLGILTWSIVFGLGLRHANDTTKDLLTHVSDAVSQAVRWVINFAPLGIMSLVFMTVAENGIEVFVEYGKLIAVLLGCMAFVAFVVNPIIVFTQTHKNPFPLVFKCLENSFIPAFFTRSSAANIPVNMRLCEELGLDKNNYSVSIPIGATINMAGAAITIAVMTLAAVNTLGIEAPFAMKLLLCFIAALSACGASGVAGGSLLLIPLNCAFFSIPNDIAMQVVGVGFIIGVIQDSCETGLNSSTDVIFTAAAEDAMRRLK